MCFSLSPFSVCASNKKHQIYFATGFSVNCLIGCEIALDIELYDYRHTVCICVCVCARTHTFRRQTSQRFIPICTLASISEFHSINAISFPLHKIHVNFVCFCWRKLWYFFSLVARWKPTTHTHHLPHITVKSPTRAMYTCTSDR